MLLNFFRTYTLVEKNKKQKNLFKTLDPTHPLRGKRQEQRLACDQLDFSTVCSRGSLVHEAVLPLMKMGLSSSINEVKIISNRHAQRPMTWVILGPVKLTMNTNYHNFITSISFDMLKHPCFFRMKLIVSWSTIF